MYVSSYDWGSRPIDNGLSAKIRPLPRPPTIHISPFYYTHMYVRIYAAFDWFYILYMYVCVF